MAGRRLLYLTALCGGVVFYWAYREWLSFVLLMAVVFLPWLSLLLSLPAMLSCRLRVDCPCRVSKNDEAAVVCTGVDALPMSAVRSALEIRNSITGQRWRLPSGRQLPTGHCGALTVQPVRAWVYDYLGLFRLPLGKKQGMTVLVCPQPVPVEPLPDTTRYAASSMRPKPGGGFSEHHELRLYRPGDSLKQVHWKLSAKTGKLIFREAMEPVRGKAALTMVLCGTPEQMDDMLGRLLYMSLHLCEKNIPHEIRCLTGRGMEHFEVDCPEQTQLALDALLCSTPAAAAAAPDFGSSAWRCHIGGGGGEA